MIRRADVADVNKIPPPLGTLGLRTVPTVAPIDSAMSEDSFQRIVIDAATLFGWRICHIRAQQMVDPRTGRGNGRWSVPYEGHSGLPDLILVRAGLVLLVELKSAKGVVSADQRRWLDAAGALGVVWRPADWPAAYEILRTAA